MFTFGSSVFLACLRLALPGPFADPHAWVRRGQSYVDNHLSAVAFSLTVEVALACALAFTAAEVMSRRSPAPISPFWAWSHVLPDPPPARPHPLTLLPLPHSAHLTLLPLH